MAGTRAQLAAARALENLTQKESSSFNTSFSTRGFTSVNGFNHDLVTKTTAAVALAAGTAGTGDGDEWGTDSDGGGSDIVRHRGDEREVANVRDAGGVDEDHDDEVDVAHEAAPIVPPFPNASASATQAVVANNNNYGSNKNKRGRRGTARNISLPKTNETRKHAGLSSPVPPTAAIAPPAATGAQSTSNTNDLSSQGRKAARTALELNKNIQAALREELAGLDDTLAESRKALDRALARVTSRAPAVTNSSGKFMWARAVDKFLEVKAPPGIVESRKKTETLLRMDPWSWQPHHINVCWYFIVFLIAGRGEGRFGKRGEGV